MDTKSQEFLDKMFNEATLDKTKEQLRGIYMNLTGSTEDILRKNMTKKEIIRSIHSYILTQKRAIAFNNSIEE